MMNVKALAWLIFADGDNGIGFTSLPGKHPVETSNYILTICPYWYLTTITKPQF